MSTPASRPILIVEDDDFDAKEIRSNVDRFGGPSDLARSASEALDYLFGDSEGNDVRRPRLVLLDWNIPDGGATVLKAMRANEALSDVPVVVFSWSMIDSDAQAAYRLGANAFVEKVPDINGWERTIHKICDFWLNSAKVV